MAHTFLSWYRRGFATQITEAPIAGDLRIKLLFEVDVEAPNGNETIQRTFEIAGPADVASFNHNAIIRTEPADDAANFEWGYLPFVEFYDEDIPWRFTPEPPKDDQLRPWFVLFVLKKDAGEVQQIPSSPPGDNPNADPFFPAIRVSGSMLAIPPEQSWAWAHVQVTHDESEKGDLKALLEAEPDRGLSRIFCPRKLEPQTAYEAYLVPAYESGRKAGLGEAPNAEDTLKASWQIEDAQSDGKIFPFYYRWAFSTDSDGDFESLLRRLKPWPAQTTDGLKVSLVKFMGELGLPPSADATLELEMPTLLTSVGATPNRYIGTNISDAGQAALNDLASWLNTQKRSNNGDPVLAPIYGARYHKKNSFNPQATNWANELNLDPRYRALAALGASVVRKNQDKWVEAAQNMIGDLEAANQRLHQARFAAQVGARMYEKHIRSLDEVRALSITKPIHGLAHPVGSEASNLAGELNASLLTGAATDPVFRRILKQAQQRNINVPVHQTLVTEINVVENHISAAKPKSKIYTGTDLDVKLKESSGDEAFDKYTAGVNNFQPPEKIRAPINLGTGGALGKVKEALEPEPSLLQQINLDFGFTDTSGEPAPLGTLEPIQISPVFREAMYQYFVAEAPQFVFPRLKDMPANSVTMLSVNQAVIEAFLAGMNDEMGREFRWRQFPADPRATFFANFWDTSDSGADPNDITNLDRWGDSELGQHRPPPPETRVPELFFVFKGDLFRKFNNAVVYLMPAILSPAGGRIPDTNAARMMPVLRGATEPDLLLLGFSMTEVQAQSEPGYYLAIEERVGSTRLGLDAAMAKGLDGKPLEVPVAPTDLSWLHLTNTYADVGEIGIASNMKKDTSANMAGVLYQQQACILVHLSKLVPNYKPVGPPVRRFTNTRGDSGKRQGT